MSNPLAMEAWARVARAKTLRKRFACSTGDSALVALAELVDAWLDVLDEPIPAAASMAKDRLRRLAECEQALRAAVKH